MNPLRFALEEAREALQKARNQSYAEMLLTGEEIRQCELAIQSASKALADDEEAEADAQRARDKCIGANGYDINRLA